MGLSIYSFHSYRDYLRAKVGPKYGGQRGQRASLAQCIPCQLSYLARILSGEADFSLEQAFSANRFFGHSKDESHYFLLLVQMERAGSAELKIYFRKQIDALQEEQLNRQRLNIQKQIKSSETLNLEQQTQYYSAWYYAAIHILCGIPALQNKEALSRALNLSLQKVSDVCDFLMSVGLIKSNTKGGLQPGRQTIHLERDSYLISKHHNNWRLQAMKALDNQHDENIHYSVVFNISKADGKIIKQSIVDYIENLMKNVWSSKDEEFFAFNLDFFKPGN